MSRFHGILLLVSTALTLACCSGPGFDKAYRKSVDAYHSTGKKPAVAGPWEGHWKSNKNEHSGKLRAIAAPASAPAPASGAAAVPGDGTAERYEFRYQATWAQVLSGGYNTIHDVRRNRDGSFHVTGSEELFLMGEYCSEGTIEGDSFDSTYQSDADEGVFILRRPEPADGAR